MMYRSSWATAPNQERILAIWLKLDAFHELLQLSEQSTANRQYESTEAWKKARNAAKTLPGLDGPWTGRVNIQWDPDHTPTGQKYARRAIQIGIKKVPWWGTGECFEKIVDVTPLVDEYRDFAVDSFEALYTPHETLYMIPDKAIAVHSGTETTDEEKQVEAQLLSKHRS